MRMRRATGPQRALSAGHYWASARSSDPRAAHVLLPSADAPARPPAHYARTGTYYLPMQQAFTT